MPIRTITVPVKDLDAAKALYAELLATPPYVDQPYYVGFRPQGGPELGLDPHGDVAAGPVVYWHVEDIAAALATLVAAGATEERAVHDVGGGALTATVRDADGNLLGLFQSAP
ncbi:VOC family protein [Actinoplanes teichomyceticus]|uniref:Putative enzyme related to lactoylglutathione lyase n=1 Tax=Actinoplanes teichomyceticus TaxID=1867 RepID=A0A561WJB9_ACTTI|nr:VOC family protein [Actinoplanes teichomyceticus]TWG23910.1 putative enzyme related to lactoylglutathione lyase [Actinoplanes teichomyceticus]GIF11954.1 glyoxalase [Actinoplanes teichomyceticus]